MPLPKRKKIYLAAGLFALLALFHYSGLLSPAETAAQWALRPLLGYLHRQSSAWSGLFQDRQSLSEKDALIASLRAENQALVEANASLGLLMDENQALRDYLLFQRRTERVFVMAGVIARGDIGTGQARSEFLTIDRGESQGLETGLAVVSGQGTLVGKLVRTGGMIAEVRLSSSPDCRLAAKILNQERTSGIVQGDLGLTMKMGFIPQSVSVAPGDIVVSSGLEEKIPEGLVIGRVSEVRRENNELWQEAVVEPLYDPEKLSVLAVILP